MKSRKPSVKILRGSTSHDERGAVSFINSFHFAGVKRCYVVENANTRIIRAFHGHFKEEKYVFVIRGKIVLCVAPIDDQRTPSKNIKVTRYILSGDEPSIVKIPAGYANGFRSLTSHAVVMFFSTASLSASKRDDFRFPADYWGNEIWKA
jgi:dTDP-4-dehydrorhamnose 3,5-epimerase-like enzyme